MRWIPSSVPAPADHLEEDYKSAHKLNKVRFGQNWLFFPKFSGTSYIPYDQVHHAWLRQEAVSAKCCCGRASFDQFYLMVEDSNGTLLRCELGSREKVDEALERIRSLCPTAEIGYWKKEA